MYELRQMVECTRARTPTRARARTPTRARTATRRREAAIEAALDSLPCTHGAVRVCRARDGRPRQQCRD